MSSVNSVVELSVTYFNDNEAGREGIFPKTYQYVVTEDGTYLVDIRPFQTSYLPIIQTYSLLYLIPSIKLDLVLIYKNSPLTVNYSVAANKPLIIGSELLSLQIVNTSSLTGILQCAYLVASGVRSDITWGDNFVTLGDQTYDLGGNQS